MSVYEKDKLAWVEQAIASILSQSYQDFLFVIVIDGPVDSGLRALILNAAKHDSRLVILENTTNLGLAASMNVVINWSLSLQPKYFFRMDSDDYSETHRLAKQVHYLEQHQNVAVVGSSLLEINEHGDPVGIRLMPVTHQSIIKGLPRRCTLNHPTVAIRFDVFRDGFRYRESLANTQDYFLWIELAANGYVFRNLKDTLLKFRRVNDFYKRRGLSKSINEFKARWFAMITLKRLSPLNMIYSWAVLLLRLMPSPVIKLAYRLDRHMLERFFKP